MLILWWLCLGPKISWEKVQVGSAVKWIGVAAEVQRDGVGLALDQLFAGGMLEEVEAILRETAGVAVGRLRKLAGGAEWAASVVPYMKAIIGPL